MRAQSTCHVAASGTGQGRSGGGRAPEAGRTTRRAPPAKGAPLYVCLSCKEPIGKWGQCLGHMRECCPELMQRSSRLQESCCIRPRQQIDWYEQQEVAVGNVILEKAPSSLEAQSLAETYAAEDGATPNGCVKSAGCASRQQGDELTRDEASTSGAPEERRVAPDGLPVVYTQMEFVQYFGGLDEWHAAPPVPLPRKANGKSRKGNGHQAAVEAGLIPSRRRANKECGRAIGGSSWWAGEDESIVADVSSRQSSVRSSEVQATC